MHTELKIMQVFEKQFSFLNNDNFTVYRTSCLNY